MAANKTRSLLNELGWDTQKLLEQIFEGGKRTEEMMKVNWVKVARHIKDFFTCEVCFDEAPPSKIRKLDCNHRFCLDCVTDYISLKIREEGGLVGRAIGCPGDKCLLELDDNFVLSVLKDGILRQKYQQIIANSFVEVRKATSRVERSKLPKTPFHQSIISFF